MRGWLQHLTGTAHELIELVPGEPTLLGDAFLADGSGAWRAFAKDGELYLDGARVTETPPLQHGQVLETSGSHTCARFFEHEPVPPLPLPLVQAVQANPADEFRWLVLADWLEEHGDDRAAAIRGAEQDDGARARRFGPLARHCRDGNLEVTWGHGFPVAVVLRALERELWPSAVGCVERLLALEDAAFVRALHVDLASSTTTPDRLALEVIARVEARPGALERLTLGPLRRISDEAAIKYALAGLGFEASLLRFEDCFVGDIAITGEPQLAWFSGEPLAFTRNTHGPWLVRPEGRFLPPVRVNGHLCASARLMHGDVIEPASGVRVNVMLR